MRDYQEEMIVNLQQSLEKISCHLDDLSVRALPPIDKESHRVESRDEIQHRIEDDVLIITFKREVGFNPQELFQISVTFIIAWKITNDAEEVNSFLAEGNLSDEENDFLIDVSAGESSLLIAQASKALGFAPLVTPPMFTSEAPNTKSE